MPWASYQCSFTRRSLAIAKSHRCNTLQLAPAATTVSLSKKRPDLNTGTCCDGFDVRDSANDIEFHRSDSDRGPTDSPANGYTLSRERRGRPPRFAFDVLAPIVGFSVVLHGQVLLISRVVRRRCSPRYHRSSFPATAAQWTAPSTCRRSALVRDFSSASLRV